MRIVPTSSFILLSLTALAVSARAELVPQGPGFRINIETTGEQVAPTTTWLGPSGFVVAWRSDVGQGWQEGIAGRLVDATGAPAGAEIPILPLAERTIDRPDVDSVQDGTFAVVWGAVRPFLFQGARFDTTGARIADFDPPRIEIVEQLTTAVVAAQPGGESQVAYHSGFGTSTREEIFGQRFAADGSRIGDSEHVSQPTQLGSQLVHDVAGDGRGGSFVFFGGELPLRHLGPDGRLTGLVSEEPLAVWGAVDADASGNLVTVWGNRGQSPGREGLMARLWDRTLSPRSVTLAVSEELGGHGRVAMDRVGNFVVVWRTGDALSEPAIKARLFDRFGRPQSDEIVVSDTPLAPATVTFIPNPPAVALGDDGTVLVTWSGEGEEGAEIYGRLLRAEIDEPCATDGTTLCLNRGRFQLRITWEDFAGGTGAGRVAPVAADDSGLFWFFAPDNWEMLVKVIDGCPVNDHFWVFSAATTNVGYQLEVTDTVTGEVRTYSNPVGHKAETVTDTAAFATCR